VSASLGLYLDDKNDLGVQTELITGGIVDLVDKGVVTGNRKTKTSLIVGELAVMGVAPGAAVGASDARVEAARYRLLSLGYFLDVQLSVTRGSKRGSVVLVVSVEERGTLVINELFLAHSEATLFWGGADVSETNFLGRGINLGAGFVASSKPIVTYAEAGLGLRLHLGVPPLGNPNGLGLAVTTIEAGSVGDELFMTRGHVHRDAAAETYVCTEGRGVLLLSDGEPAEWLELGPGDVAPIPAGRAHRTVNVGRERFSFLAVYELGAGNDYDSVARRGVGARVLRFGDGYRVVS